MYNADSIHTRLTKYTKRLVRAVIQVKNTYMLYILYQTLTDRTSSGLFIYLNS